MTTSILAQRPTVAPTAPKPTVSTYDLSREAVDYLKAIVRKQRMAGVSVVDAAWYANRWCAGYRSFGKRLGVPVDSAAAWDGYEYAKGEDAWWQCQEIDAAQASADAANLQPW